MAEAKIRISAEDRTPEGFRSVERRLREFSASAAAMQNRLRNIFGGIGAAVGVGAISNFAQAAVQAAVESEQAGARLDIVIRNLGNGSAVSKERVEQLAEELSKLGRFDDDEIKSAAAELLKFGNISTVVFEDALRSAKGVATFFNDDLRSSAQKVAKALADPEAAFKLLKEVGIAFTDSQKEAIKTLGETQGIAAQQQVIVRELAKRYADLDKELSGGLTGTINELNKAWGNLLESFGLTVGKLGPVALAFRGLSDVINAVRSQVESATKLPQSRQPQTFTTPIGDVAPEVERIRRSGIFLPGSRTPISEIIPGSAASPIAAPSLRPAPIFTEDERKRLRATLGESSATLIEPSETTGKPKKEGRDIGASDFDALRRSLESQLTRERDLTVELTLVEDERFKKLGLGQRNELVNIARRVDTLKLEKVQKETVEQSIELERSLREVSTREELAQIEERKLALSREYEDRKISAQEYYSFIAAEETKATLIQQRDLELDAGIELARASDTSSPINDRLTALAKESEIRQRITDIVRQQASIEQVNARAAAQADNELLDRKVAIAQQLNSLRGTPDIELDRLALERQFRDLPEDFKMSVTFQTFLDTTLAEQQLATFERKAGTVQQTLEVTEDRNQLDFESGTINRQEFRSRTVAARREAIDELSQLVRKIEEVKAANEGSFGPEQEVRLVALKTRLEELRNSADEYLNTAKEIGAGPTTQFFEDIITGSKDAQSAFDDLVTSIKANIAKLLAEEITNTLFGELRRGAQALGGVDGVLSAIGIGTQAASRQNTAGIVQGVTGSGITLDSAAQFFGFGASPTTQQRVGGSIGLSSDIAAKAFGVQGLTSQDSEEESALPEFIDSLSEGAAALFKFNTSTEQADSGVENFSGTFESIDLGTQLFSLLTASTQAVLGTELLATATTDAAAQIALAGSASTAGTFSADGNIFSGGYHVAFAKGGAFDDGEVQAFATGGIVSKPTTFPIRGGKTGLMGEAGPEAIMPLTQKGGRFSVYAIGDDGKESALPLTRGASGKLSVKLPNMGSTSNVSSAFAIGGAFVGGVENTSFAFADGAVFTSTKHMPVHMYQYGGVANRPQLAVFGEGSRPEAFVPLPDGRSIPVTMDAAPAQGITIVQNISTQDANSFRRSRASLFNDANAALSAAAQKR